MSGFLPSPLADDGLPSSAGGTVPASSLAIKQWTRDYLHLDDDAVVIVTELACADPGCPLLETVIAVFEADRARKWRLHRPKVAVTKIMIQQALAGLLSS